MNFLSLLLILFAVAHFVAVVHLLYSFKLSPYSCAPPCASSSLLVFPLPPRQTPEYTLPVPWGLNRFQESGHLHFITFSCFGRLPGLSDPAACQVFERALEQTRRRYDFFVTGYVVMPEHVHLLMSEPKRGMLSQAMQALKQGVSRRFAPRSATPFWLPRYFDFNVWSERKRIEKLRYIHRNPVERELCTEPQDWPWSSFRHYKFGEEGIIEIESEWTFRRREAAGITLTLTRK